MTKRPARLHRFNRVERGILEAVAKGKCADFSDEKVGDQRVTVSGEFLSNLWLERIEGCTIHPVGIVIKGLEIEGPIALGGARQSQQGRDGLVGFGAEDCIFREILDLQNAKIETIGFTECEFAPSPDDPAAFSIELDGAEIAGSVVIDQCVMAQRLFANNLQLSGEVRLFETTLLGGASFASCRVGTSFLISNCRLGDSGTGYSLYTSGMTVGGPVLLLSSLFRQGVFSTNLNCTDLIIDDCRMGSGGFAACQFAHSTLSGRLRVSRSRFSRACGFPNLSINGDVSVASCLFRDGLHLSAARAQSWIKLEKCILHAAAAPVGASQEATEANPVGRALDLSGTEFKTVMLEGCAVAGHCDLSSARIGANLDVSNCIVGGSRAGYMPRDEGTEVHFNLNRMEVGSVAHFQRCLFYSLLDFQAAAFGSSLVIAECFFCRPRNSWGLALTSLRCEGIVCLKDCILTAGVQMPLLEAQELQFEGNWIGPGGDQPSRSDYSLWASDCRISRRVTFGKSVSGSGASRPNAILGTIDLSSSIVGENLRLASTEILLPESANRSGTSTVVNLERIQVAGNLMLAPYTYSNREIGDHDEEPANITGCVNLDDAQIGGDLHMHLTRIEASGRIARPEGSFGSEERVTKRKRGVAISLRDATVNGELELGRPVLSGLVDLRDATIGLVSDGGGDRWEEGGIQPGQLLLDGLTYRDLDNVLDGEEPAGGLVSGRSDAAARRLHWLTMQYPDRQPTPDTFVPQPYQQLAGIFAAEGNERARRQVLIERRDMQRRHGRLPAIERGLARLLKLTSNYGYSPFRAVSWLLGYIALGAAAAEWFYLHHAIALFSVDGNADLPFNALVFAIDSAIPIIDLGQDSLWSINPDAVTSGFWSGLIVVAKGLYELVGMLLLSVTILTLTGTLQEKE